MKWIAEYADLHGIQIAPHGVFDGLFGLAAHVQVAAALPQNYIAFEYPLGQPDWWYDIVEGLPDPIVEQWLHQRLGPAGSRCHLQRPGSKSAPVGRRSPLLRLMGTSSVKVAIEELGHFAQSNGALRGIVMEVVRVRLTFKNK